MHKRYLECNASELVLISKTWLLEALASSEGRVLLSETIGSTQPMLYNITNAELAASQGADLILLNLFDVDKPMVNGLPLNVPGENSIHELQRLTGRVIGVNLEAVDPEYNTEENLSQWKMQKGRLATAENARKAVAMGAKFIVLTGNPGNGISNKAINHSLAAINAEVGNKVILIAGKMHAAGILTEAGEKIINKQEVTRFVANGANIILIPAPGTVPGITVEYAKDLINHIHGLGALAMTAIGTSQEGSDPATIRQIALMCKMAGTDLHHIGDSGYFGMALPENILTYSIAIRGIRHTYTRIARSVNR